MAPPPSSIANQLRQLIYYHLDSNLLQNALFLSERLSACDRSGESAYLISLCHLRLGDNKSAQEFSRLYATKGVHLGCAYVFAQACLALGTFKDGITTLEKCRSFWQGRNSLGKHTQSRRDPYPDAAAVNCLLGKLYYGYEDKKAAIRCYEESLKLNPFMWDAFTGLCDMGCAVRVPNIFKGNSDMEELVRSSTTQQYADVPASRAAKDASLMALNLDPNSNRTSARSAPVQSEGSDPFNNPAPKGFASGLFGTLGLSQKINESTSSSASMPPIGAAFSSEILETPTGSNGAIDVSIVPSGREPGVVSAFSLEQPPHAPPRRNRTLQNGLDLGAEIPPRMSRAISTRRPLKSELAHPGLGETGEPIRATVLPPTGGEKKRTVSGQPRQAQPSHTEDPGAPQRRSVRLFNQVRPSGSRNAGATTGAIGSKEGRELKKTRPTISKIMRPGSGTSTVGRAVSGNRKPVEEPMDLDHKDHYSRPHSQVSQNSIRSQQQADPSRQEAEALQWLLELFKKLGYGYFNLAQYKSDSALEVFATLPQAQQSTPWVLAQMGRAHYAQARYTEAETQFKRILNMAPTRFQDMEIYSTVLWHLKKETDLSFLAHELIDADWHSPQAWCVLGNAWSLARDHETALRCFKRATQLDPHFAYAFTLQGHEHVANEEFEKALSAYRQAMSADRRHYNAYYGIGRVYEALGSYDKALSHYAAAAQINPTNAVLLCCIGTIYEKQKNSKAALKYFSKATELAPKSALTRFKKARALMAMNELEVALQELMILKDLAPDEAMVHFLLGRLYKNLREKGNAVKHFTIALNLDPKVHWLTYHNQRSLS